MSNCNICGRKTQVVQRLTIQKGKFLGWTKIIHRCEIHGNQELKLRKAKGDRE